MVYNGDVPSTQCKYQGMLQDDHLECDVLLIQLLKTR